MKHYVIILVSAFIFFFIVDFFEKKRAEKLKNNFNNSNIEGTITKINATSQGVAFKINNNDNLFKFVPYKNKISDTEVVDFENIAEIGDSIFKGKNLDYVILKTKKGEYNFTFAK